MDKHKRSGFTVIETILTIAIAGLILLMVFIALPAVLRSSRDSERRDDMLTFVQKLKDFQANANRGALPSVLNNNPSVSTGSVNGGGSGTRLPDYNASSTRWYSWTGFYHDYLPDSWMDPDGIYYNLSIIDCGGSAGTSCNPSAESDISDATSSPNHTLAVVLGASCAGESVKPNANPRKLAVLMRLESGGVYCVEN